MLIYCYFNKEIYINWCFVDVMKLHPTNVNVVYSLHPLSCFRLYFHHPQFPSPTVSTTHSFHHR